MPKAKHLLVTETGGNLRTIRTIIQSLDEPDDGGPDQLHSFELKLATAEEVLVVVRQLLDFPEGANAAEDGSIHIGTNALGTKLFATGQREKITLVERIVQELDGNGAGLKSRPVKVVETSQVEVHEVSGADPSAVLRVLQTLLAAYPDVRLEMDPQTGNLVALAPPSVHATIRATIAQMQGNGLQIEVFRLRTLDPRLAVLSIDKLFSGGADENSFDSPNVDADWKARQLIVRGTAGQIEEIRTLLVKLGETGGDGMASDHAQTGMVRMLPITGYEARAALNQIQRVWSELRSNRLHIVRPPSALKTLRLESHTSGAEDESPSQQPPTQNGSGDEQTNGVDTRRERGFGGVHFVSQHGRGVAKRQSSEKLTDGALKPDSPASITGPTDDAGRLADIVVAPGPGGIMIASDDSEALDLLAGLIRTLANQALSEGRGFSVVYLKYASAEVAAELLARALGIDGVQPSRLSSAVAAAVQGDVVSPLVRSLIVNSLGGKGTSGVDVSSGRVDIVADVRLNALIIHAEANDLILIQQLLEVIDQESGPEEVLTVLPPRLIPVLYTNAEDLAEIVRDFYLNRVSYPSANLVALQRGARTGRGLSLNVGSSSRGVEPQVTIGVDRLSNSLIVSAPVPLFEQIKALVAQLDQAESSQTVQIMTLNRMNLALVEGSLAAILGNQEPKATVQRRESASGIRQQIGSRQEGIRQPSTLNPARGRIQSNDAINAPPRAVVPQPRVAPISNAEGNQRSKAKR